MEPVSVIVNALAAGAKAALPGAAKQVVADSYEALKALLKRRFSSVDVTPVERDPESQNKRGSAAKDLQAVGADKDRDVLDAAIQLLELIAKHAPHAGRAVGVDLAKVRALRIELSDIAVAGPGATGVRLREVDAVGDIRISSVLVRAEPSGTQNPQ
jgi:hypothetical protein